MNNKRGKLKDTDQPNTLPDPLLIPMYARNVKAELVMTDTHGRPFLVTFAKIWGALP